MRKLNCKTVLLIGILLIVLSVNVNADNEDWIYQGASSATCVAISTSGDCLAIGTSDGVCFLDGEGNLLWDYPTDYPVIDISMTADASDIVANSSKKAYFFDTTGSLLGTLTLDSGISSVSCSPHGKYFTMTYGQDFLNWWFDKVALWGYDEKEWLWRYTCGVRGSSDAAVSINGEYVVVGGARDIIIGDFGELSLYNKNGDLLWKYSIDTESLGGKYSVAISTDGQYMVAGNTDNENLYFFERDQALIWSYNAGDIEGVGISGDGSFIVGANNDKVYLFDSDKRLWWVSEFDDIKDVAISADANTVTVSTGNGKVYKFLRGPGWTPNQLPHSIFNYSPELPKVHEWVTLDASASYDSDGKIAVYEWDLDGDGEFDDAFTSNPIIYYYWDESDNYEVMLRTTDDDDGSDIKIHEISIQENSWWNKIKNFFASDVVNLSKKEEDRFYGIVFELDIGRSECDSTYGRDRWAYIHNSTYDLDRWTPDQLLTVLWSPVDPLAGSLTHETLILDTLHDMKLADSVANRSWTGSPVITEYFENMAEINVWAKEGLLISKEVFKGFIRTAGGSSIGVGVILMLPDLCQAGIGIAFLDQTFYRRALWHYFRYRELGHSPGDAFGLSPVSLKYDNETTNEYFETLWTEYGGEHMESSGGLKQGFKNQIIRQLRKLLVSSQEKYQFSPYHLYIIKSPVAVQVYDSSGRVTGLVNGQVREEIPNSAYNEENKTILIFGSNDSYMYEAVGTNEEDYGLDVVSLKCGMTTSFFATDIPTSSNAVHQYVLDWDALSQGEAGATIKIDADGDGVFERTIISNNKLTPCKMAIEPIGYKLVSREPVGETEFEYTFQILAKNSATQDIKDITFKLAEPPNNVSVIDGIAYFSLIKPGEEVLCDDTFKLRSGESFNILEDEPVWEICNCFQRPRTDFSGDWYVDFVDLAELVNKWLEICAEPNWCRGDDLDHSTVVDFTDFAIFAKDWLWKIIPADFDIDEDVDFFDYTVLANHWMDENCAELAWCESTDLNKNGQVDFHDLRIFAEHWLEGVTP